MRIVDDIQNQKAVRLAKQVDPHGLRTIGMFLPQIAVAPHILNKILGVLTKPDTLSRGASRMREMWLDVLEGRDHQLKHGYFCTRQPDDDKRLSGVSPSEARAAEAEFFKMNSPWSTSISHSRFGTPNLVKSISELLTKIISDS